MKTQIIPASDPSVYSKARDLLEAGQLVAFPTDTVYGVGTPIYNTQGIASLYVAKIRDASKAIPILLGDAAELMRVADTVNDAVLQIAHHFWPGPLTLVVPRRPELPEEISPYSTVGVRMPNHPVALTLLRLTGPMAVTSANQSGHPDSCSAEEVLAQLEGRIALIIDGGRAPGGKPSTVVDCSGNELAILRQGPISLEEIKAVIHPKSK